MIHNRQPQRYAPGAQDSNKNRGGLAAASCRGITRCPGISLAARELGISRQMLWYSITGRKSGPAAERYARQYQEWRIAMGL